VNEPSLSEILFQLGEHRENYFGAVSPPLIHSSNFAFKTVADYRKAVANEKDHSIYTRGKNPTTAILCEKLAALEGAEDALVFSSGSAAVAAAVFSCVESGDHVICVKDPYSWTNKLFTQLLSRYGINLSMVEGSSVKNFEQAIKENTRLIYLESPNSLTLDLQDIEAIASLARKNGISTILDNSYASPLGQSPLKLGVDIVVHSATKYLAGHSDLLAGAVCASADRIRDELSSAGIVIEDGSDGTRWRRA
jgi:cystathionine beta-lyase/cystathionine gamma-synthase